MGILGEGLPGKLKAPQVRVRLKCFRSSKENSVTGKEWERRGFIENVITEVGNWQIIRAW